MLPSIVQYDIFFKGLLQYDMSKTWGQWPKSKHSKTACLRDHLARIWKALLASW